MTGDLTLLRELIANLLDNAIRYTPARGRVTVRVARAAADVLLDVADDGPGIPEAERERVFERLHRVLGTGQESCGLGLAIVREIADRHGGTVTPDSGSRHAGPRAAACDRLT